MIFTILTYIAPALGAFILACFVLGRRNARENRYYFLFSLMVSIYVAMQLVAIIGGDAISLVATKISSGATNFIVYFVLLFSLALTQTKIRAFLAAVLFILPVVFLLFTPTDYIIKNVEVVQDSLVVTGGVLYDVQAIFLTAYLLASLIILARALRGARGSVKSSIQLVVVGLLVPIVTNTLTNTFFLQVAAIQFLAPLSLLVFVAFVGYAIVKHRLFDIKAAAVRSAVYGLSILTLAGIYYLAAYFVSVTLFKGEVSSTVSLSPINITLALVLAFIFQPIKNFFDKITDDIFYRDRYNTDDFYSALNETLTSTTDLRSLLIRVAKQIADTLKAEQAFLFVQYNHVHHVSGGTKGHDTLPLSDVQKLNDYVKKNGDAIVVSEFLPDNSPIQRLLISHKTAILMPLMRRGTVLGYLALGEQQGSGDYTGRDIRVLNTISDELVIAIQNALSVQEVKDINIHLQQRIDAATKELKATNTQLRHLDATKDEFLSMASHQLRTPLTSVKGYLSMVLEGDAGKISDSQKHLLGEAFTSSERMVHLIHDFLNVSRLQTGKFTIESKPVDLVKLIEAEVKALKQVAAARDMQLEYTHGEDIPMLALDETKMQQVVMNYIDNALYYSRPENPVVKIELTRTDKEVELRVIDGGIGVPESEKEKLFEKFFRAGNARQKRPDGTGVGIYLAKKVIDATGGDIIFESEVGKGSTFGFRLPIGKLSVSSEEQSE